MRLNGYSLPRIVDLLKGKSRCVLVGAGVGISVEEDDSK